MRVLLLLCMLSCLIVCTFAVDSTEQQERVTFLTSNKRVVTETAIKRAATDLEGTVIAEAEDAATAEQHAMLANEQKLSDAILSHNNDAQSILQSNPALKPQLHAITDVAADLLLAKGIANKLAAKESAKQAVTKQDIRKLRLALGFDKQQFSSIAVEAQKHGWNHVAAAFSHITKGFESGINKALKHKARASKVIQRQMMANTATNKAAVKGLYDDTVWSGRLLDEPNSAAIRELQELAKRYGLTHIPLDTKNLPAELAAHPLLRDAYWRITPERDHTPITSSSVATVNAVALARRERALREYEAQLAAREAAEKKREQLFAKRLLSERIRRALANAAANYHHHVPYVANLVSDYPAMIQTTEQIQPHKVTRMSRLVKPKIAGVDQLTPDYKDM